MALTYDECVALSRLRASGMTIPVQLGALSPDVRKAVERAHAAQRQAAAPAEPPKPWSQALQQRESQTPVVRKDGIPQPYASALAQRKAEGR